MAHPQPLPAAHPLDRLVGRSPAMHALRAQIQHLAAFDGLGQPLVPTVLLCGETGTGKGLVARVIHDCGPRAHGPFIEINCAAIPDTLLEAELYGVAAGAFTDAKRTKAGLFEAASGGTLFLDEIDALPLALQGKLLTAIEAKRVRRLGAVAERPVDVKLIAATQAELSARVRAGTFRGDLYQRLAVVLLDLPPLRERGEDVLVLAEALLQQYVAAYRLSPRRLSGAAQAWLRAYPWPGNVRELSHLLERVMLLSAETIIDPATLERLCLPQLPSEAAVAAARGGHADEDDAARITRALQSAEGNVARAARLLGWSRKAVRYRMRKYGILRPPAQRPHRAVPRPSRPGTPEVHSPVMREGQGSGDEAAAFSPSPISAPSWEQKPVAVLALELSWPVPAEGESLRYEPWTVTRRWQQLMLEKLQGFGGVLLQRSSSLLLVAFGLPHTLEQLPRRAVQAALAVRRLATGAAEGGPSPELRLALHWAQVLVDTGASDPAAHLLPVGDALARPGRLLGSARPGEIVASAEMGRLVGGWCELRAREPRRGVAPPDASAAYTVVRLSPLGSPLTMHRQRPLSPFVGRERELAILGDLLGQAREGRGQLVGIIGEPGVGKSRLCYEFARAHSVQGWRILAASADASGQATPYLPVIELLKSYFQIASRDAMATGRDKVAGILRTLGPLAQSSLSAVLTLLDVPVEDDAWQALDPPQRRRQLLDAIKRLLIRESQIQPLLLVAENLHWIDGETQALLETLIGGLATTRILLLATYRPEYHHGWGSKTYYTQLRLDPLSHEHAHALFDALLGDDAGLVPLRQNLWQRTEGNPFFLEESVQTLVETQVLVGTRGAYRLANPLQDLHVPATVQAVLAARIDRLPPPEKRLLQGAAVIGMEVPWALVQAVVEVTEAELHQSLARLQATEFLYETNRFPGPTYTFKHALTQEVAYGSLLQGRRRVLHARLVGGPRGTRRRPPG
jgi:DNA-binding NtrC family response regulator